MNEMYHQVIEANIMLHTRLASEYNECEPQYRPENIARLNSELKQVINVTSAQRVLDLGCGTGFMIDILRPMVQHITGVDVTQAMLDRIDTTGDTTIELILSDTGSVAIEEGSYDLATAHSFLHHLFDIRPTLQTAYSALKPGGIFYSELDPNYYFWEGIHSLNGQDSMSDLVRREYNSVASRDSEIESEFGIEKDVFNMAEYGKNIAGGFKEEFLSSCLHEAGFSAVRIKYHWFIGQSLFYNSMELDLETATAQSSQMDFVLRQALPISRGLYKYVGFEAIK
ncbi:MAG: class I SAM-dependent DNA methyltransferase [Bacteroidota bacterium]|jgi:ubiquinone/menaquinone biosynthesis C-methylase UbiE